MSYRTGPTIVTSGLICYLDALNPKSYVSGSATVYDLSQNGNDFTLQGDIQWTQTGGWTKFDGNLAGSGNKIYRDNFPANLRTGQGGKGWTAMTLAMSTATNNGFKKLFGNWDRDDYLEAYEAINGNAFSVDYSTTLNPAGLFYNGGNQVSNNSLVMNTSGYRLYITTNVNSTGVGTSNTVANPTGALSIGNEPNNSPAGTNAYPWRGNIQSFLLYSGVLSTSQMLQNWNALRSRVGQ